MPTGLSSSNDPGVDSGDIVMVSWCHVDITIHKYDGCFVQRAFCLTIVILELYSSEYYSCPMMTFVTFDTVTLHGVKVEALRRLEYRQNI